MSMEKAKEFLVKVSTDKQMADKVREAHQASLLAVAQESGFDIDADDLRAAMSEIELLDDLGLTDATEVVGGVPFTGRDSVW